MNKFEFKDIELTLISDAIDIAIKEETKQKEKTIKKFNKSPDKVNEILIKSLTLRNVIFKKLKKKIDKTVTEILKKPSF